MIPLKSNHMLENFNHSYNADEFKNESNDYDQLAPLLLCDLIDFDKGEKENFIIPDDPTTRVSYPNLSQICDVCGNKIIISSESQSQSHDRHHMIQIIPYLYLGTWENAHNMLELFHFKINLIVNVAYDVQNKFYDA